MWITVTSVILSLAFGVAAYIAHRIQNHTPSRFTLKIRASTYFIASLIAVFVTVGISNAVTESIFGSGDERVKNWNAVNKQTETDLIRQQLPAIVERINKSLPRDVDTEIRIESVKALDMGMEYLVTLKNFSGGDTITDEQKRLMFNIYQGKICKDNNINKLFGSGLNIIYKYQGIDEKFLHEDKLDLITCAAIETVNETN